MSWYVVMKQEPSSKDVTKIIFCWLFKMYILIHKVQFIFYAFKTSGLWSSHFFKSQMLLCIVGITLSALVHGDISVSFSVQGGLTVTSATMKTVKTCLIALSYFISRNISLTHADYKCF